MEKFVIEKVMQLRRASSYGEKLGNYIKELEEENKKLKETINEAVELLENPYNIECISQCNDVVKKLTGKESEILKSYKDTL